MADFIIRIKDKNNVLIKEIISPVPYLDSIPQGTEIGLECRERGYKVQWVGNYFTKSTLLTDGVVTNPPPTPTPTGLIWSSNLHGKWNNGTRRIVTDSEGSQSPNGKGLYMAASGDPELRIDGNGIGLLVSGSGGVSNCSEKSGGNRHGMGGDCQNRFGGVGNHIAKNECGFKIEKCHNVHEDGFERGLSPNLVDNKWYKSRFTVTHFNSKIQQKLELDRLDNNGFIVVLQQEFQDPLPFYMAKEQMLGNSEFWERLNNDDHGRFYVRACNYDSILTKEFMFKPSENAIAYRNIEMVGL